MDAYDPSTPTPGENETTMRDTEHQVSIAYKDCLGELDVLLKLAQRFEEPPQDEDLDSLKQYRRAVVQDVTRLQRKIGLCQKYIKVRDRSFHYKAKRLRTQDRSNRLRWWWREKLQEVEAARLQRGDEAAERARTGVEEARRVTVKCYGLDQLWKQAVEAEKKSMMNRTDDSSSGCETTEGEDEND